MNKFTKILLTALCLVLVVALSVGGTLAWLTDNTDTVTNTFTVGDINITLVESPYDADKGTYGTPDEGVTNSYPLIPGNTYKKDPVVTVKGGSEACYLFVMFEEVNSASDYLTYTSNLKPDEWTQGTGTGEGGNGIPTNVWYREVAASTTDTSYHLLDDDEIEVKTSIVKANPDDGQVAMPAANAQPQLKYTAYAVQKDNLTAAQAWAEVTD